MEYFYKDKINSSTIFFGAFPKEADQVLSYESASTCSTFQINIIWNNTPPINIDDRPIITTHGRAPSLYPCR